MAANDVERLDGFGKILLATQTINYLASRIDRVATEYKFVINEQNDGVNAIFRKSREAMIDALDTAAKKLTEVAEEIANYMNDTDMVTELDIKVIEGALDVLNGNDEIVI